MARRLVNITPNLGTTYAWQNANLWQDASRRAAILARFWAAVQRPDAKACWVWTGSTNSRGYGLFLLIGRTRVRAHRLTWLLSRGEIPAGMEVCHSCDNTLCVNPDHLFLGTHRDNHLDSVRKGRKRAWGLQKLNAAQVVEIRARCAAGERQKDVGRAFGIARNTVSGIVNRKTWSHLYETADTSDSAGSRLRSAV
jgi:hypothetical protein